MTAIEDNDIFYQSVGDALCRAIQRLEYASEAVYLSSIRKVLLRLAKSNASSWSVDEYRNIVCQAAEDQNVQNAAAVEKQIGPEFLNFVVAEDDVVRPTSAEDLEKTALVSGALAISRIRQDKDPQRDLAHNYCLSFPERMSMLKYFSPPGNPQSVLRDVHDMFLFHKKINSFLTDVFAREAHELGMIQPSPNASGSVLYRLPASAIGWLVVGCWLRLAKYRIDIGLPTADLETQLGFYVSPQHVLGPWQKPLGCDQQILRAETSGSQVRLTREGFLWMVAVGLVDPLDVAQVLRVVDADGVRKELGRRVFCERVRRNSPRNADEVLTYFT